MELTGLVVVPRLLSAANPRTKASSCERSWHCTAGNGQQLGFVDLESSKVSFHALGVLTLLGSPARL